MDNRCLRQMRIEEGGITAGCDNGERAHPGGDTRNCMCRGSGSHVCFAINRPSRPGSLETGGMAVWSINCLIAMETYVQEKGCGVNWERSVASDT